MKKGLPCNDYYYTVKARKNRIVYRFVTEDGNTPTTCTVHIGDTDPLTGEPITDLEFFMDYYRLVDHQIYVQNKESKGLVYLDGITDDEGRNSVDKNARLGMPTVNPFDDPPEEILRLREVAATLTGRQADVYEALLIKYAGGKAKISMTDLARKWGVSVTQICKDRDKILKMIREKLT